MMLTLASEYGDRAYVKLTTFRIASSQYCDCIYGLPQLKWSPQVGKAQYCSRPVCSWGLLELAQLVCSAPRLVYMLVQVI